MFKTIDSVVINSADVIKKLADMAPKEPEKPQKAAGKPIGKGKKSSKSGAQGSDLGALDVTRYLGHYGVDFNIKAKGSKTLYRLNSCLFDPSHGKNEAAIVQDDRGF